LVPLHRWRLAPVPLLCISALIGGLVWNGGCSRQPPSASSPRTLRLGSQQTLEAARVFATMLSAEPLLVLDWHGRALGRLASEWHWEDDGRALSVRLRPTVHFQDGSPVTADAVATVLRKSLRTDRSTGFQNLTSIETPDDRTLTFRLSRPDSFLVEAIAGAPILDDARPDIRTGPFRILSRKPGIVAERYPAYHRGTPGLERIEVTIYDTQRAVFSAMIRGAADMVPEVNPESIEFLEGASQFETSSSIRPFYIPLVFNLRHPVLRHAEVRRALVQAIDREEIVRQAMRGHGRVADDPIWPAHWAYTASTKGHMYDPAAARLRLDAAGFPVRRAGGPDRMPSRFQLNCIFYNKDFQFERIAVLLQRQLEAVGVDLVLTSVDEATLTQRVGAGDFDSYVFQLTSGKSFDWTYRFWHSEGGYQTTGYSGADDALDMLRRARLDADIRAALGTLRQRFYEDAPAAFLAWPETTRAVDTRFDLGDRSDPELFANLWRWRPGPPEPERAER
jgi:peptide/nickel transport system substrate-binding protein